LGSDIERDPSGKWNYYLTPDVKLSGTTRTWLHRDNLASVRAVTSSAGAANRVSVYKPYGEQVETVLVALSPTESKGHSSIALMAALPRVAPPERRVPEGTGCGVSASAPTPKRA
jgi:hypothetical protein